LSSVNEIKLASGKHHIVLDGRYPNSSLCVWFVFAFCSCDVNKRFGFLFEIIKTPELKLAKINLFAKIGYYNVGFCVLTNERTLNDGAFWRLFRFYGHVFVAVY